MNSYNEALIRYNQAKPWRGGDDNVRKLRADSSKHNWSVSQLVGRSIAFKYHRTQCVIWHPDDTFTLHTWASKSTSEFIARRVPDGFYIQMTNKSGPLIRTNCGHDPKTGESLGQRFYVISNSATFKQDADTGQWVSIEGHNLIDYPRPDRARAKAALAKHDFPAFKHYVAAALAITQPKKVDRWGGVTGKSEVDALAQLMQTGRYYINTIIQPLADRSKWMAFLKAPALYPDEDKRKAWGRSAEYTTAGHVNKILDAVRMAIYQAEKVCDNLPLVYAVSDRQLKAAHKAEQKYG